MNDLEFYPKGTVDKFCVPCNVSLFKTKTYSKYIETKDHVQDRWKDIFKNL